MVDVVEQLCIKSFNIKDEDGKSWSAEQGKEYTTTVPKDDTDTITVFSNYWVKVPKSHFVIKEKI